MRPLLNTATRVLIDSASPWSWVTKTNVMPTSRWIALQLDLHLLAQLEVERAERLVEQQHLGPVDEGAGEGDALALAAAQLVRAALAERAEADDVEHLRRPAPPLDLGDALAP